MVSFGFLWAGGQPEPQPEPEPVKEAAPAAVEDWDAIYEAAKKEGKVVIYSLSSRVFDAVESFKASIPGYRG